MPRQVLCSYFETRAAINSLDIVGARTKTPIATGSLRPVQHPTHVERTQGATVRAAVRSCRSGPLTYFERE